MRHHYFLSCTPVLELPPLSLLEGFSTDRPELPCVRSTTAVLTIANCWIELGRFPVLSKVAGRIHILTASENAVDEPYRLAAASELLISSLFHSSCSLRGDVP